MHTQINVTFLHMHTLPDILYMRNTHVSLPVIVLISLPLLTSKFLHHSKHITVCCFGVIDRCVCVCSDTLGARLDAEGSEKHRLQACLCFICSGNIERLVECWTSQRDCSSPLALEVTAPSHTHTYMCLRILFTFVCIAPFTIHICCVPIRLLTPVS